MSETTETRELAAELRSWTRGHDGHVRAAVDLLIHHQGGMWLRREDFTERFVQRRGGTATVDFAALAAALEAGTAPGGSTTKAGVLRQADAESDI